jgi:hypothetical protein
MLGVPGAEAPVAPSTASSDESDEVEVELA